MTPSWTIMSRAISRYPSHWPRDCMTSLLRWFRWRCGLPAEQHAQHEIRLIGLCQVFAVWSSRNACLIGSLFHSVLRRGNDNYYCHSVSCFSSSQNRKCHSPITFSRATECKTGHPASVTFDTTDSETIVPMHSTLPTAKNNNKYIILLHCTQ